MITNGVNVSRRTISYVIVLNCISSKRRSYRTVRCTRQNRLLVQYYYLRLAEFPQIHFSYRIIVSLFNAVFS